MPDYRSRRAAALVPYVAGEQPTDPNIIKLNTNENPYPPASGVAQAIQRATARLPLYPPTDGGELRLAIAEHHRVGKECIFVGNGSDEVLAFAFLAFFDGERPVRAPQLTYSFYPVYADLFGVPYTACPMKDGFAVDVEALLQGGAVVIANPNAPTTLSLPLADLRRMAETLHSRGELLLVDEAYVYFGGESAEGLVAEFDNLLIVRTLSKAYSLAGLRIGYALGQPHLIDALMAVKDSFNSYPLDHLAVAGGAAAVRDEAYLKESIEKVVRTRDAFIRDIRSLGMEAADSCTNFVFAKHPGFAGEALFQALRQRNILVRHFNRPPIQDYLRITIGTPQQMDIVRDALREIIGG